MAGSTDNVRSNQVLDFTPPADGAGENIRSLSHDNGLGSLKLGDVKNIGSGRDDSNSKSGGDNVLDLNKPIGYATSEAKALPADATKPPSMEPTENTNTASERGETSIDFKFESYDLPDGGKLLVGKSDHKDLAFKPVILDKDGKFVRNTGGGGGGGSGPNGERLPESRGNSYSNGASDRYTEGDDKYHYTDANGKEHTIQLKDKISFKEPDEPDVELPEKELGPELKFDPTKSPEENLKQGFPSEMGDTIKTNSYDLPDGDKLVTWEMDGRQMHPLVMQKNGDTFMVRGGGGGGGGGGGVDANGDPLPSTRRSTSEQMFSNGAVGSWSDGSSTYTYTDRSGKSTVLQLSKPMSM